MPSAAEEAADPSAADRAYATAVRVLIQRCRGDVVLHEELIAYGQARNLYAVRRVGAVVSAVGAVAVALLWSVAMLPSPRAFIAVTADAALFCAWVWLAKLDHVLEAQYEYVDRLMQVLEGLSTDW